MRKILLAMLCILAATSCSGSSGSPSEKDPRDAESNPKDSNAGAPAGATYDGAEDESADPPSVITGGYLVGKLIASNDGEPVRIGIVGMKDDVRISDDKSRYESTWTLEFAQNIPEIVTIRKSEDSTYDQVLEFNGTLDQLRTRADLISVTLQFRENIDGSIVNRLVDAKVSTFLD